MDRIKTIDEKNRILQEAQSAVSIPESRVIPVVSHPHYTHAQPDYNSIAKMIADTVANAVANAVSKAMSEFNKKSTVEKPDPFENYWYYQFQPAFAHSFDISAYMSVPIVAPGSSWVNNSTTIVLLQLPLINRGVLKFSGLDSNQASYFTNPLNIWGVRINEIPIWGHPTSVPTSPVANPTELTVPFHGGDLIELRAINFDTLNLILTGRIKGWTW